MHILVVEDSELLGESIQARLQKMGHGVDWVNNGRQANGLLQHQQFDLIILDLNLPELGGEQILSELRKRKDTTPVLILTAREQVDDRIKLLDAGADDYLTKPFDFGELEARCRVLMRRNQGFSSNLSRHGNLSFDRSAKAVYVNDEKLDLKNREFRLLEVFLGNLGRVMSKEELADRLFAFDESPGPNAIELYIARLRKKLADSSVQIRTLRGLGYLAECDDD
ncbi:Response regulator consisting of a CheY-like receiver domain and a winged-helix DNA-binding domain [Hahella chejuensis KCTC 2396]|uniref:Response regulator consisting of a CheY-like receiver domain and a winged-helix DNA-binding domain n=1 Tax=Hahella chejuensis (strain KCTC 2396) TaxID=349521 RepID=Q2SLI1_HAHCH|nr:response regulator transcription factor [Hahella chejuensis]ABC28493.1 Response regulator consisting of a CheY-like receiver domain and a winged-helix DNA-binding domain [Hahella chejuensis KCTC 2396]